mgnify:FL=1
MVILSFTDICREVNAEDFANFVKKNGPKFSLSSSPIAENISRNTKLFPDITRFSDKVAAAQGTKVLVEGLICCHIFVISEIMS